MDLSEKQNEEKAVGLRHFWNWQNGAIEAPTEAVLAEYVRYSCKPSTYRNRSVIIGHWRGTSADRLCSAPKVTCRLRSWIVVSVSNLSHCNSGALSDLIERRNLPIHQPVCHITTALLETYYSFAKASRPIPQPLTASLRKPPYRRTRLPPTIAQRRCPSPLPSCPRRILQLFSSSSCRTRWTRTLAPSCSAAMRRSLSSSRRT